MAANTTRTIKGFILTAAFVVSAVLFAGLYLVTSSIYDDAVRRNASSLSDTLAQGTFNAMFQIMRKGWTRPQLEEFVSAVEDSARGKGYSISIYRGDLVSDLYGPIDQALADAQVNEAFRLGRPVQHQSDKGIHYAYPLVARQECLACHTNARIGATLGVIAVDQDLRALIQQTKGDLLLPLLLIAPLPFLMAVLVAWFLTKRINESVNRLQQSVDSVNSISDLTHIEMNHADLGFVELNNIFANIEELTNKLKGVAVDKELLEFEIRLLEKFVITSEVVRDWREYVCHLLVDINYVIDAYTLFSIFKVDDELFDLEVFWIGPPTEETKTMMEASVRRALAGNPNFDGVASIVINHNIAQPQGDAISLGEEGIELQTKSLIVDTPKIGGIVGIGVNAQLIKDQTRLLVMESILSTLLNVVGSVKAIYKYTKDLEYYATRDPLTNVYNQRLFWELLGYEVSRAQRHNYRFSLLVVDLDNFKSINDTYGHSFGDRFLRTFSEAIGTALRLGDVLARYGGDEFVLILPEAGPEQAYTVSERILKQAAEMVLTAPDGAQVRATVSIGISVYPDHASDVKDLFLFADNMMYKAKNEGRNRIGFPTENEVVEVFRSIGEKSIIIANAIEKRLVIPFFQPILNTETNTIDAVEVLSRIRLEDGSILGAHEFIEIAEKTGLIHKIDYIVMEKAFRTAKEVGYTGLIFVNLSPRALVLNEFIVEAKRLTAEAGVSPAQVVFEITERDTVKNFSLLEKFVNELKMEGFGLAIDDFGSGFSSFHYLKHFPIDFVKIEGDFIVNMTGDAKDRAFVHSISSLAGELGIKALAEFVESAEVLECVRGAGITYAQGYYIGRPSEVLVTEPPAGMTGTGG